MCDSSVEWGDKICTHQNLCLQSDDDRRMTEKWQNGKMHPAEGWLNDILPVGEGVAAHQLSLHLTTTKETLPEGRVPTHVWNWQRSTVMIMIYVVFCSWRTDCIMQVCNATASSVQRRVGIICPQHPTLRPLQIISSYLHWHFPKWSQPNNRTACQRLNSQTVCEQFPLPTIDDYLKLLAGTQLPTVLDCDNGHLQVPLTEQAKEKTTALMRHSNFSESGFV